MRRQNDSKRPTEIPLEAEAKPFDFDSMPCPVSWVLWALKPADDGDAGS